MTNILFVIDLQLFINISQNTDNHRQVKNLSYILILVIFYLVNSKEAVQIFIVYFLFRRCKFYANSELFKEKLTKYVPKRRSKKTYG